MTWKTTQEMAIRKPIRYEVPCTGGKVHSDIYNAYMGKLLATLIADDCQG